VIHSDWLTIYRDDARINVLLTFCRTLCKRSPVGGATNERRNTVPGTSGYGISQLTNLCKTLAAAILLTSSTHFGARLGAFFY